MVFVFDLDDTVCDTDGYSEKYILNFFKENNYPYTFVSKTARYAEEKFSWDKESALKWYKTFGDEMMKKFPLKENAKEFINGLYESGHTIIFSTARATDWHTDPEGVTLEWLNNVGLKYHKLIIGKSKKEEVCFSEGADVFVDDDLEITARVASYKMNKPIKVFLMNSNFNLDKEKNEKVVRINSFNEMLENI